jgi:hypothetical protein
LPLACVRDRLVQAGFEVRADALGDAFSEFQRTTLMNLYA